MFANPRDVQMATEYGLRQGQDKAFMANKPGEVMGTLAYAHPFLDGNGRTIMTVHAELASRAGIRIEWEKTNKADYLAALTHGLETPGAGVLDAYLKPYVQRTADRQAMADTLKELPGLGRDLRVAPAPVVPAPETAASAKDGIPAERAGEASGAPSADEKPKPRWRQAQGPPAHAVGHAFNQRRQKERGRTCCCRRGSAVQARSPHLHLVRRTAVLGPI
jgi:hypothetical protein